MLQHSFNWDGSTDISLEQYAAPMFQGERSLTFIYIQSNYRVKAWRRTALVVWLTSSYASLKYKGTSARVNPVTELSKVEATGLAASERQAVAWILDHPAQYESHPSLRELCRVAALCQDRELWERSLASLSHQLKLADANPLVNIALEYGGLPLLLEK